MQNQDLAIAGRVKSGAFLCVGLGVAAVLLLGPFKGLVAIIGLIAAFVGIAHPIVALAIVIFANTSMQVIGSAHILGAPTSLSKMGGALALGAVILHAMFAGWKLTASPIFKPLLLFLVVVVVWDLLLRNPETGYLEGSNRYLLSLLLTALTATIAGQSQRGLDLTIIVLSAAIALTGIIGLMEHFLPSLAIQSDDPRLAMGALGGVIDSESLDGVVIKRITGGIGDANWLSYTVAMSLPLLIYAWHRWTDFWTRLVFAVFGGLQVIALTLSYTRTGFLGLGIAGLYLIVRGIVPLRPLLAVGVAVLAGVLLYLPPGFADRMFSSKYLSEGSTPLRKLFVTSATEIWLQSPWVGHGFKGFGPQFYDAVRAKPPDDDRLQGWATDMELSVIEGRELVSNIGAHNLELEVLVEYGMVGFVLFFAIFYLAFRELWKIEKTGPPHLRILAITIEACLIAFLVCGIFGHAKYLKSLWILFGLVMAARRISLIGDSPTVSLMELRNSR